MVLGCALLRARRQPVRRERPFHARVLMAHLPRPHLTRPVMHPHLIHEHTTHKLGGHLIKDPPRTIGGRPHDLLIDREHVHINEDTTLTLDVATANTARQGHHRALSKLHVKTIPLGQGGHDPHPVKVLSHPAPDRPKQVRWGTHTSATFRMIVNA